VFNKALAMQKALYEGGEKKLGYAGLCKTLTEWRHSADTAWLSDAPVHPLQQTLKALERAYANFFAKRADFPRFKKKGQHDSFRYPDAKQFKIDQANSRIFLPKLGWIRYRNSRDILGQAKNITVSDNGGKWFVSIQTEREVKQSVHPATAIVAIDVGITRLPLCPMGATSNRLTPSGSISNGWHATSVPCLAKRSSAATGRRRTPASRRFPHASPMRAAISCTRPRPQSAKTTQLSSSRTCADGICPSPRQAAAIRQGVT
jgi:hypothetical protein